MEIWKNCGMGYEISDRGRVCSVKFNRRLILKTRLDRYGYELVTFWSEGKSYTRKVHRLVALAFIENPRSLSTVNHKDGIKTNNKRDNLEWNSVAENHVHAFKLGLHTVGENRKAGRPVKLTESDVVEIKELILKGYGNSEIGHRFRVSCGCIYSIRVNKSWTHVRLPEQP